MGVKFVHKPAHLKNNIVLLGFGLWHHYDTILPLDLLRIVNMHRWRVFQNHILQISKVYNFWILILQIIPFTLHLVARLPAEGHITENA
jgi:hypothetical protein